MPNLIELREKYPQYSDMSDQEFADKFHEKFYFDIPKDEFYEKINFSPSNVSQETLKTRESTLGKFGGAVKDFLVGGIQGNLNSPIELLNAGKYLTLPQMRLVEEKSLGKNLELPKFNFAPDTSAGTIGNFLGGLVQPGFVGAKIGKEIGKNALNHLIKTNLTSEQLARNIETVEGTNTALGDVIDNPFLKRLYENTLTKVPFSHANQKLQETADQISNKGRELLDYIYKPERDLNIGEVLKDALRNASKEATRLKNENWSEVNRIAEESGLNVGRSNFKQSASKILSQLKESPELMREYSSDLLSDLKSYSASEAGNSLKLSNIFKGKLGDKASELLKSGKNYEYGIHKNLKDSLQKDIDEAIEFSENPKLRLAYEKANEFHRKNIAPFEDKDIIKFTKKDADPDKLLSHFISNSRINDRANLLNKLVEKLPENQKYLPAYGYFSRAFENGKLNPIKFTNLFKSLMARQKSVLIPNAILRHQFENYSNLVSKNSTALNLMANPNTGQKANDLLSVALAASAAKGPGNLAKVMAIPFISRKIVNALTSPKIRTKVVNKLLEKPKKLDWESKTGGKWYEK